MAIFHCYVSSPEGINKRISHSHPIRICNASQHFSKVQKAHRGVACPAHVVQVAWGYVFLQGKGPLRNLSPVGIGKYET